MDGESLIDFELAAAARGGDLHRVALFLVQEGAADRRRGRDHPLLGVGIFRHHQLVDGQLVAGGLLTMDGGAEAARSCGMRSMLISEISATRFCSMLMRDSTSRCRSFAAWYSAFSRRSPSSRARWISFGSSSLQLAVERADFIFELLEISAFICVDRHRSRAC